MLLPWAHDELTLIGGAVFIVFGLIVIVPSLIQFAKSRNSLITIKAATSLQTSGIYSVSRNPMYLGLMMIYIGMALLKGNVWTFLFIPVVMMTMQFYVIRNEENYLAGKFPGEFGDYVKKVRRWI
jgi:protein-S-isoprenylcysteine O-methyltransferase Ste14